LLENQDGVLTSILIELEKRTASPHPNPLPVGEGNRGADPLSPSLGEKSA
jgi:hypothetical protein